MKEKLKVIFFYALAGTVMLFLLAMIFALLFIPIPTENEKLLYTAFGLALGWGTAIVTYFLGTSKSSADKTEIIARNNTNNLPTPTPETK